MRPLTIPAAALLVLVVAPAAAQQSGGGDPQPAPRLRAAAAAAAAADADEMARLVNELRAREARLLSALAKTSATEVTMRRDLEQQLARTAREAFALMSVVESRCLERRAQAPRGYLGVTIDNEMQLRDGRVGDARAMVASVEPGSPAAAAGLQAGDRLLSIGGRDFTAGMPRLGDLLEPGRRLVVRVQRDGAERDVPVVVGQGGPRMDLACPEYERVIQPLRMGGAARVWIRDTSDGGGDRVVTVRRAPPAPSAPPTPGVAVSVAAPPAPPAAPAAPGVFVFGVTRGATGESAYYNGAQFRQLDDDWRGVLGVRAGTEGVLVTEVAPGTAAASAGLRTGDVVLSVDGTPATSPFVVVRLLTLADRSESRLRVFRARDTRTVVFTRGTTPRD